MKDQLIQSLESAGYKIVRREALAPNLVAVDYLSLEYEPLSFSRVRVLHSFAIWMRTHTLDSVEQKAKDIMNVLWQAFNEISELRAEFDDEVIRVIVQIPEEF